MARYRTYKNGIIGHRYKGYYIVKGETKGTFSIWNEDKTVYQEDIYDYDDCEWIIDKKTANPENLNMMRTLFEKEIYQLSGMMVELIQKRERQGLDEKNKNLYELVLKIRKRKIENRQF